MGVEVWLEKPIPQVTKKLNITDYPGYTYAVLQCLTCEDIYVGLYCVDLPVLSCPRCGVPGVKELRRIRRIYLQ